MADLRGAKCIFAYITAHGRGCGQQQDSRRPGPGRLPEGEHALLFSPNTVVVIVAVLAIAIYSTLNWLHLFMWLELTPSSSCRSSFSHLANGLLLLASLVPCSQCLISIPFSTFLLSQ